VLQTSITFSGVVCHPVTFATGIKPQVAGPINGLVFSKLPLTNGSLIQVPHSMLSTIPSLSSSWSTLLSIPSPSLSNNPVP
jgi:hypothetical protein